ncbi:MAG: glycosyltransferase [Tepidisphaeraceae bacterium]
MASLLELVDRVNKGELIEPQQLEVYQDSTNAAEKFLSNHAHAMLDLRRSHAYLKEALEAIDYADQKVLFQFLSVLGFLGLNEQRCEPVIRFGNAAIRRREFGLAMEAIQSGLLQDLQSGGAFLHDRASAPIIAAHYDRCSQAIGWCPPGPRDWHNAQLKIGYVTTAIADDDASDRLIAGISKHLYSKQTKFHVYSTEATVRREKQSFGQGPFTPGSAKRGKETVDQLSRRRVPVWFGPLDHDLAGDARELANQIFRDQIDVLIIDAHVSDPVAAVLGGWTPAKAKIQIVRRFPILSGDSDHAVYFDAHRFEEDQRLEQDRDRKVRLLCEGVEPVALETSTPARSAFGIPEQSVLLTTLINDADEPSSPEFFDAVVQTLRQNPAAVLLVAGDGDMAALKRRLESSGLTKRAGFVGKRKDLTDLFRMSDIYLAPFPAGTITGTLTAMAAGRAVVAQAGDPSDPHRHSYLLDDSTLPTTAAGYVSKAERFIQDPALRARTGEALKQRATAEFAMEQTVKALDSLCRTLVQPARQDHAPHAQAA